MPLILFNKHTTFAPFGKTYVYAKDVVYEVPEGLAVKFCSQMGVAVLVESAEDVQPNPSAEIHDSEGRTIRPGATPESAPEPTPEATPEVPVDRGGNPLDTDEAPAARYKLKGRGGPWFSVIDTSTGEDMPGKPMRKSAAEKMIDELANQDTESAAE